MNKIIGLLVMGFLFLPWRPIVAIVAAVLFVNINGTELYGWQAGLAHGLFFLPNLVRHLFDGDVLFKATNCTTGYHVAWWIATVGSCIGWLVDATFSFMKASVFVGSDKVTMFANANAMTTVGRRSLEALRLQPLGKPPQCFS